MLTVKRKHHCALINSREFAICDRDRRLHARLLSYKRAFSEEIARIQYGDRSFLAIFGNNDKPYFPFQDVKDRITICALRVDCSSLWKRHNFPALTDRGEELFRVEITFLLTCTDWRHNPANIACSGNQRVAITTIRTNILSQAPSPSGDTASASGGPMPGIQSKTQCCSGPGCVFLHM